MAAEPIAWVCSDICNIIQRNAKEKKVMCYLRRVA